MDTLSKLLSSRVKAELFRLLFSDRGELHQREIARQAYLSEATVRQELKRLTSLGLVAARRDGNRVYYRARPEHPLYPEIRGLVRKTSGLAEALREYLVGGDVRLAFVFGSMASGKAQAESDIDLMVIGSMTLRELTGRLLGASGRLAREVNPHVMKLEEFVRKRETRDRFVRAILEGPKLFVIGDDRELERLGQ